MGEEQDSAKKGNADTAAAAPLPEQQRIWVETLEQMQRFARRFSCKVKKTEADEELIRLALHRSRFFTCLDQEQIDRFIKVAELKR